MPAATGTPRLGAWFGLHPHQLHEEDIMRARLGIIAATVTALSSLALPAHAGSAGGVGADLLSVTAADCMDSGGTVNTATGVCDGGSANGQPVSG